MDRMWCGGVYFTLCHLSWCCLMWNVSRPGGFSDRSLKHWFLINSGERCFYQPRSGARSGNNFSPLCAGSLSRTYQDQPDLLRVTVQVLLLLLSLVYPSSFLGHTNPFLPPHISLTAPCLMLPLPVSVSGFAPNTLFSLWRNIFKSPGVAAVDNGNLLCFMCLENEFPCQKRRAITTSKRDQIGSLKRK